MIDMSDEELKNKLFSLINWILVLIKVFWTPKKSIYKAQVKDSFNK
jgi:hypothetical protein